jgi:hypothetical protein
MAIDMMMMIIIIGYQLIKLFVLEGNLTSEQYLCFLECEQLPVQ